MNFRDQPADFEHQAPRVSPFAPPHHADEAWTARRGRVYDNEDRWS